MTDCNNNVNCTCTYSNCAKHGKCCECIKYHLRMQELPACCFPSNVERSYDRSFRKFIETYKDKV